MTARADTKSVRSIMRKPGDKLNILTFATHERYEENLCKTGHNFYSLRDGGKEWDVTYAPVPDNYNIVDSVPSSIDIDIVLSHTSCQRIQIAHDILSGTVGQFKKITVPILRHCHVLPDIRLNTEEEVAVYAGIPVDKNSFISDFNRSAWGFSNETASVIKHGVDTEFWHPSNTTRTPICLSVVNHFPDRDWCCGFNLWQKVTNLLPKTVIGQCLYPTFSQPARDKQELRLAYQQAGLFLNTSIHSPVPTVMLEAMACGCPVVSTKTCMIPEIIEHGVNGFISNDPQELEGYCRKILNDSELASKMGTAARKTIEENYNLSTFVENWNNLLYDTIGEFRC